LVFITSLPERLASQKATMLKVIGVPCRTAWYLLFDFPARQ